MTTLPDWKLTLVESWADVDAFVSWVEALNGMVSIDTETWGLDWWERDFVRLVTFADDEQGWAVPVRWWGRPLARALATVRDKDVPVAMWNATFDMHALDSDGFPIPAWRNVHDGMVLHHLLVPHVSHALKTVAGELLGDWARIGDTMLKHEAAKLGCRWWEVPVDLPAYWQYGIIDTLITQALVRKLLPEVLADDGLARAYDVEMQVSAIMWRAERRGIRIDAKHAETVRRKWLQRSVELKDYLASKGVTNPNSNRQLEKVFRDLGWEPEDFTETGQAVLDKIVLRQLSERWPELATAITEYKRLVKWTSAYLSPFAASGGRVHPTINTLRARTGRMSITNPALQTLPSKGSAEVRACVLPEPGCSLWSIDYDSQEARIAACMSGDRGLIDAFNSGEDMYTHIARMVWDDTSITKDDPRRATAKVIMLALLYGAGASTLSVASGLSVREVEAFLSAVYRKFPGIRRITGDHAIGGNYPGEPALRAAERLRTEGLAYVKTRGGRRFSMPADETYKAVNGLAQGSAADMTKAAIVRIDRAGLSDAIIVPVHDELVLSVPKDHDDMAEEIRRLMEDHDWAVPMTAQIAGPFSNWGEAYQ